MLIHKLLLGIIAGVAHIAFAIARSVHRLCRVSALMLQGQHVYKRWGPFGHTQAMVRFASLCLGDTYVLSYKQLQTVTNRICQGKLC